MKHASDTLQHPIVPIFKQPPKPDQDLPQELADYHHHEFFRWDPPGSFRFREFSPDSSEDTSRQFWETLGRLAQDLMAQLETLKGEARRRAVGTVYVARAAPELNAEREKLRSDLQQRGYLVVPEREYLWNSCGFPEAIAGHLEAAQLCIHLIPCTASIEPKAIERARVQLELAAAVMKRRGKTLPLVWIQPAVETDAAANDLIKYIERTLSNDGVEYWQGSLEDFKTHIYDTLPKVAPSTSPSTMDDIALIMEEGDVPATGEIISHLVETLRLETHRIKFCKSNVKDPLSLAKTLGRCGRCIVFWGAQPEEWVSDLLILDALAGHVGREKLCIYAASPDTPEKSTYRTNRARMIHGMVALNDAELREFLSVREIRR
jgi:hypothetical protein